MGGVGRVPVRPWRACLWIGCMLALALLGSASAMGEVQGAKPHASARLSAGVVALGDQVVLDLVVENASRVRVTGVPKVEGLTVAGPSGPYTSRYMEVIGGRRTDRFETVYKFSLRPQREGEFEIPAFNVDADGQTLRTKPLRLKALVDLAGSDLGFLEVTPSSTKVVEGQPFTVELRFGWDSQVSVNYAELILPWWEELSGALELDGPAPPRNAEQVVVNHGIRVSVERVPPENSADGEDRVVYRLRKSYLPTRSGTLEFQKSYLEFGRVSDGGFFNAQRKLKKYFVNAPSLILEVIPLPEEGQPFDFSGAVGHLEAHAAADTRDVIVGDSIKLTVDWTGSGNLEFFDAPDLSKIDAFRGFQVYGSTESKSFDRRQVVFDLAPLSEDVSELPPVPLSVFDPEAGGYAEVETRAIPIHVRPLARALSLEGEEQPGFEDDIADIVELRRDPTKGETGGSDSGALSDRGLLAGAASLPVLWLLLRIAVRRRGDPAGAEARRRRGAERRLRRALRAGATPAETLRAFSRFLADQSGEREGAWSGRDPLRWAEERGRPDPARLAPTRALLDRLEAAAFAAGPAVPVEDILNEARRLAEVEL